MIRTSDDGQRNGHPAPGTSLALLTVPYIFTQDELLTTDNVLRHARDRGQRLTLDLLQRLHEQQLVVPFYRVDSVPVEGQRIDVEPTGGMNARGWVLETAASGRLRDPAAEGYSSAWPYVRPPDMSSESWWNGFVYSSWQLLDLADALNALKGIELYGREPAATIESYARSRRLALALAALSPRYLPAVLGRYSLPFSVDASEYWRFRTNVDPQQLLSVAGLDAGDLQRLADNLLLMAHSIDPLAKWVKLLRYASFSGWSSLRGEPLNAMWRRVAAELLLRAHEELADLGTLPPLPELAGSTWHAPQHDRLTPRYPEAETLERALAELGLSPHPGVILLVEGETEMVHLPLLLAEFGLGHPQHVRVQLTKGSRVSTQLIARYGVTPRIGRRVNDQWLLNATPTALVIAMDAENKWATVEDREHERRKLQEAVREEVRAQGADISQDDLDLLVKVHVWGEDKYELANFTDDELVTAAVELASKDPEHDATSPTWRSALHAELRDARQNHVDIKIPFGRMRIPENKVALAKILWPVLLAKCEAELVAGRVETPVLKVVLEVRELVTQLSRARALEVPKPTK